MQESRKIEREERGEDGTGREGERKGGGTVMTESERGEGGSH